MQDVYNVVKDLTSTDFHYGSIEDRVNFIIDNYGEALTIYRLIVNSLEEADKKRDEAHTMLQKLRSDEERWNKTGKLPNKFDAEEHQTRKERLTELREKEYDIMYKNGPLPHNKLTNMIIHNMWLFKRLNMIDLGVRNILGPISEKTIKALLWPMTKMMYISAVETDNYNTEIFLKKQIKQMNKIPKLVKEYVMNP